MPPEETGNELQKIIEVAWRRKWVILVPFTVIFTLVTLWALYQPNIYRSSSSIFIESQKIPTDVVRSTVSSDLENRLRTISQQLTSRTKILKVITELDLYPEERAEGLPSEVLVELMRKNLEVEVPRTGRGGEANFFYVHFQHRDPTKAMLAVSKLVSLFIEESLQVREQQAKGTTTFIEEELAKLKQTLEDQEQAIQEYKGLHMGELPDQLDANLRMLDNLQLQLANNRESEREMENRLLLLEQEMSRLEGERKIASSMAAEGGTQAVTNTTLNGLLEQREILAQRVASMSTMYTERHPDLLTAKKELAHLDETIRAAMTGQGGLAQPSPIIQAGPAASMEIANLRRQINDTKPRLVALREEEQTLRRQIAQYQRRVESAPEREQNLLKLTRDYENTKASYEDLLSKRQDAQLAENLERRQQGENFQILDPANFPEKPFLPNRPKLIAMGFAGGVGLGIGMALFLEALFPAFYSLKQLQMAANVPITFGVPHISSRAERKARRRRAAITVGAGVGFMLLVFIIVHSFVVDLGAVIRTIGANLKGMM